MRCKPLLKNRKKMMRTFLNNAVIVINLFKRKWVPYKLFNMLHCPFLTCLLLSWTSTCLFLVHKLISVQHFITSVVLKCHNWQNNHSESCITLLSIECEHSGRGWEYKLARTSSGLGTESDLIMKTVSYKMTCIFHLMALLFYDVPQNL